MFIELGEPNETYTDTSSMTSADTSTNTRNLVSYGVLNPVYERLNFTSTNTK